ncbi:hypothetical protein D0865_11467 [Hortaea werneckii]|uniref:Uncharacterized protein n=1 Tax=Hortaea werneckii TaxID=91943 RepID=A0A3M7BTI6_HORWE|nr:hypothetical protein D0865_11467 [Hortaea werneckii]
MTAGVNSVLLTTHAYTRPLAIFLPDTQDAATRPCRAKIASSRPRTHSPRKLEVRPTAHPNRDDILQATSRAPSPYPRNNTPSAADGPPTMADQAQQTAKGAGEKTQNAPGAGGVQKGVEGATSGILGTIEGWGNWIAGKGKEVMDRVIPPEQRASILAKLQEFMLKNPKLSAFLGMNVALTGVPLGLFILFTLTVAIFSLVVGLILGLLAAVLFTLFCVGIALTIVLPTVFFTTMAACFLFLWGLGGYYILSWGNSAGGSEQGDGKAPEGQAIGDKLNNLVGGRLSGFMSSARAEEAKGDISGFGDQHLKPDYGSSAGGQGKETGKKEGQGNGQAK